MTTNFIVYDLQGKITKLLSIPYSDISINIKENEKYIEGFADILRQYVENNVLVDMPTKPQGEYKFNYTTKQWEFDTLSADLEAKQKRDKLLAEGPDRINPIWWSSMTLEEQQAWTDYRQALLDITTQPTYPQDILWPTKPE